MSTPDPPLTCREVIDLLGEYLEASLTAESAAALEQHLRDCRPCVAYLNTYRKTRDLTARAGRVEMPADMRARLREFLLRQLDGSA